MLLLKINSKNIARAVGIIKKGGVIVYPTDTAYALGGIFSSKKVISKILKIKGRTDKKFTLVASDVSQVNNFFKLNVTQKKLAKKYWPGPLSFVVSPRFAVRVPKNIIAQFLAKKTGYPLIATSANLTGQSAPYSVKEILRQFKVHANYNHPLSPLACETSEPPSPKPSLSPLTPVPLPQLRLGRGGSKVCDSYPRGRGGNKDVIHRGGKRGGELPDLILDAGQLQKKSPSTIVKVVRGKIIILRRGPVKIKI